MTKCKIENYSNDQLEIIYKKALATVWSYTENEELTDEEIDAKEDFYAMLEEVISGVEAYVGSKLTGGWKLEMVNSCGILDSLLNDDSEN
ncbi:MAG: hypothetical protein ACRC42_03535 [Mycoplasma sp.]